MSFASSFYLLSVCLLAFSVAVGAWHPQFSFRAFTRSSTRLQSTSYNLNAKDLLITSACGDLTRTEINEFVLQVCCLCASFASSLHFTVHCLVSCAYTNSQLEKKNPTLEPAYSPLLNGVWEVVSSGISSPGMLGFQASLALSLRASAV